MKAVECQQRSDAWFAARRGIPTCSRFDSILTPKTGKPSVGQWKLTNELIAESVCPPDQGLIKPQYCSPEMEAGMKLEAESRCSYELEHAVGKVSEVGFLMHDSGLFGGSPDALVSDEGGVELKCPSASVHIGYVRDNELPECYKNQVHGYLIVTGRKWWDFYSYCRHFEPFLIRVTRDDFTEKLEAELYAFCRRYNDERAKFGLPPIGV